MRRVDVVVIGAGAAGSATAWHLARRGRAVLLLEQFEQGHTRGSSHGATRIFRLAYADDRYVRLAQRALPLWRELEADSGQALLDQVGALDHGTPSELDRIEAAMAACGAPVQRLTPDEAHGRWPGMHFESPVLHSVAGGRCRADAAVRAMQDRAAAHGAEVRFATPARLRTLGDGVEVDTGGEVVRAGVAVVTAGAWVTEVVADPLVGRSLPPLTVTQEQVIHLAPRDPATSGEWPSFIHHGVDDGWVYGLLTPGEGVKVGGHHEGPATTGGERTFELDPARIERVVDYARRWLPGLEPEPRAGATCLYTTTPDEHFVLDRVGSIVIGSPCSGHGFKFTPVLGEILADLADGGARPDPAWALRTPSS